MAEKQRIPEEAIAPDRISDVAEWGDRETNTRLFGDMDDDYLAKVEEEAKKLPKARIHRVDADPVPREE